MLSKGTIEIDVTPIKSLLIECSKEFKEFERYALADQVINEYVDRFPKHGRLRDVLGKVVLINSLYSTAIYDVIKMARHIQGIENIDKLIEKGDINAVEKMRKNHRIFVGKKGNKKRKERDIYSFSTKYLNFHNQRAFPIFDNLVKRLLPELNNKYKIISDKIVQKSLYDYGVYKEFIDALRFHILLDDENYKRLDQGLWVYAKYRYQSDKIPATVRKNVKQIEENGGVSLPPVREKKKRRKSVKVK